MIKPIMRIELNLFIILTVFISANAISLSEEDAINRALENNPAVRIEKLSNEKSKNSLKSIKTNALPKIDASVPASYSNIKTYNDSFQTSREEKTVTAQGNISQAVLGGGNLSVSANRTADISAPDSMPQSTNVSINYKQPLIKGAWKSADVFYNIYLQKNQFNISQMQFIQNISSALSDVRTWYWNWISKSALAKIRRDEVEYAEKEIQYQRARFLLGQISIIDTIGANIELLKSKISLVSAEQSEKQSRRILAKALDCDESLLSEIPDSLNIPVSDIKPLEDAFALVESTDTGLRIIQITMASLYRQLEYSKNQRLPSLDLNTGYNINMPDNSASSLKTNNATVGLILSYNLFPQKERYTVSNMKNDLAINKIKEDNAKKDLKLWTINLFDSWRMDSLQYELQAKQVELAEVSYKAMQEEEQLGSIDALSRLKVKNDLIQARIEKLNMAIELKRLEIAFDLATKNIFNKFGVMLP